MFWTFDFCIILSIGFWHFFSFENMAPSEDRLVSSEDAVAFVTAEADSHFSSDFSEDEEESSQEDMEADNEEHSINPKPCRTRE